MLNGVPLAYLLKYFQTIRTLLIYLQTSVLVTLRYLDLYYRLGHTKLLRLALPRAFETFVRILPFSRSNPAFLFFSFQTPKTFVFMFSSAIAVFLKNIKQRGEPIQKEIFERVNARENLSCTSKVKVPYYSISLYKNMHLVWCQ